MPETPGVRNLCIFSPLYFLTLESVLFVCFSFYSLVEAETKAQDVIKSFSIFSCFRMSVVNGFHQA